MNNRREQRKRMPITEALDSTAPPSRIKRRCLNETSGRNKMGVSNDTSLPNDASVLKDSTRIANSNGLTGGDWSKIKLPSEDQSESDDRAFPYFAPVASSKDNASASDVQSEEP